jgi:hypothetical protein
MARGSSLLVQSALQVHPRRKEEVVIEIHLPYVVKKGDTLSGIARRYGTTVSKIKVCERLEVGHDPRRQEHCASHAEEQCLAKKTINSLSPARRCAFDRHPSMLDWDRLLPISAWLDL